MIFRAPAGHHLLGRNELEKMLENLQKDNIREVESYLSFCLDEVKFYDDIRQQVEQKKMYQEDGELLKAKSIENKMRERVRQRSERSKLFKESFLV